MHVLYIISNVYRFIDSYKNMLVNIFESAIMVQQASI